MKKGMVATWLTAAVCCLTISAQAQTWTRKTDYINGESANAYCFSINDTIYVGNTGSGGFYKYDYTTDTWSQKGDVPAALFNRTASVSFAINGKGYVVGGIGPDARCNSDVWEYTPGTDSWVQKGDFAGGRRANAGCFVVGGKAYLGGGYDTIDITGFSPAAKDDFWQYDPVTDHWAAKAVLPYPGSYLMSPFAFSISGKGYFSCGDRAKLSAGVYHDTDVITTFEYDTLADSWLPKADYPGMARSGGVSFVLNGLAYCGTGMKDFGTLTCYEDFYAYDPSADKWTPVTGPSFGTRTYAIAATVSAHRAYVGTGWQSPSVSSYYKDWWEFKLPVAGTDNAVLKPNELKCFPNPGSGMLNVVTADKCDGCSYSIYTMAGERVKQGILPADETVSVQELPGGSYMVQVTSAGQVYRTIVDITAR